MKILRAALTAVVFSGSLFGRALGDAVLLSEEDQALIQKTTSGEYRKLGTLLGQVAELSNDDEALQGDSILQELLTFQEGTSKVMVEIIFLRNSDGAALIGNLVENMGFENKICDRNKCTGWAPANQLTAIAEDFSINFLNPVPKPVRNTPATTIGTPDEHINGVPDEGYRSLRADEVFAEFGLTGAGQIIGVISDSFDCLGGFSGDVLTGDLPLLTTILRESDTCVNRIDEGRAMSQLIFDVAPGASQIFHAAFNAGRLGLAAAVTNLANAGSTITTDDVIYLNQPFFQDDEIAQAVDATTARGIPHFSSAGNAARVSWHTATGFVDSGFTLGGNPLHNFAPPGAPPDAFQDVTLIGGQVYRFVIQWDQPFASVPGSLGSTNDCDAFFLLDGVVVVSSTINNIGGDGFEFLGIRAGGSGPTVHQIAISYKGGSAPPGYIKWIGIGPPVTNIEYDTRSSASWGHSNAAGGAGVGAARFSNTPPFGVSPAIQEGFSSAGGTPKLFAPDGTRLAAPEIRQQPRFCGPDGTLTTFFQPPSNRFFGTSAAAPHVAAAAALLRERNPTLTPTQIYSILEMTAEDMNDINAPGPTPGYDFGTGWGFVNSLLAVRAVPTSPAPTSPSPTSPAPTSPAPTSPAPTSPAPTSPTPTSPAPVSPAPTTLSPVSPAPTTLAPVSPAPTSPRPTSSPTSKPTTARPTTLTPTRGPPITTYRVGFLFGFTDLLDRDPTMEENDGLARLTEIFYTRVIASLHALPYEDVRVQVVEASMATTTSESLFIEEGSGVPLATLEVDFQMIVEFGINPNVPTPETVRGNIENIDEEIYIDQFVQNANPSNSLYRDAETVIDIDAMIVRP